MKFEREATTKDGRRTWKVTYELVRGPEPKSRRKADKAAAGSAPASGQAQAVDKKSDAKKRTPSKSQLKKTETPTRDDERKKKKKNSQLGLF